MRIPSFDTALLFLLTCVLSACGGAMGWDPDPVTGITADNLRLGQTATLHLKGNALNNFISITSDKCSGMNVGQIGSAKDRTATCTVTGTGDATFIVSSSTGYEVYRTTLQVPVPVSDVRAVDTPRFGQEAVFELVGDDAQNPSLTVTADNCTLTLDAVSTDATRKARCTPLKAGPITVTAKTPYSSTPLASKTLSTVDPSGLQVANLKYNQTATLLVPTQAKSDTVIVTSDKCNSFSVTAASYDKARVVTCTVSGTGSVSFTATVTSGTTPTTLTQTVTVPEPRVTFKTSLGEFVMELNPTAAPITVKNFMSYVNQSPSFYNSTIFHRVIKGFVVHGGGYTTGMKAKTGLSSAIELESTKTTGLLNTRGSVAMARQDAAASARSEFFVNVVDNVTLNYASDNSPGYAVFGRIISGMDTIDAIASQTTQPVTTFGANNTSTVFKDVPVTDITITSAVQTQ